MKQQAWILAMVGLTLMGGTAGLLSRQKDLQRLGAPGVKVLPQPVYDAEGRPAGSQSVFLPERVLELTSQEVPIAKTVVEWLPRDTTYGQRLYRSTNGFEMMVNVVLMGADRTSIHKPEYCLAGAGWVDQRYERAEIPVERPYPYLLPVQRVTTRREVMLPSGERLARQGVFVFWFVADGELTAEHGERMWWLARDMLTTGVLQRWAYVSVFSVCLPGEEEQTYEMMRRHIAAMVPEFQLTRGRPMAAAQP